jgi:hypothetical protein
MCKRDERIGAAEMKFVRIMAGNILFYYKKNLDIKV